MNTTFVKKMLTFVTEIYTMYAIFIYKNTLLKYGNQFIGINNKLLRNDLRDVSKNRRQDK